MPHRLGDIGVGNCAWTDRSLQAEVDRGEDCADELIGVVAHKVIAVYGKQTIHDDVGHELAHILDIRLNRILLLLGVALHKVLGKGAVMQDDAIYAVAKIAVNFAHEIGGGESIGFAMLGHEITHVDFAGLRGAYGLGDSVYKQVWQDAGVEVARTNDN